MIQAVHTKGLHVPVYLFVYLFIIMGCTHK